MPRFRGSMPAIPTPMKGGAVDHDALGKLVEWLVAETSDGIVACGTTGEGATLDPEETLAVVKTVKDVVGGKVPVIAGTGSNDTAKTVALTRKVREVGVDAALVVTPYYNKPTNEGLYRHYEAVAKEGGLPVLMYNVPGRTALSMDLPTILRCAGIEGVIGIKDASQDMAMAVRIREHLGEDFALISGDDFTILPFLACGGDGVITVVGNVAPRDTAELVRAFEAGELARARSLQDKLLPLVEALFVESSPVPLKAALDMMGRCADEFRMPLTPASSQTRSRLSEVMKAYGGLI
jgi:4-hydroxy-tetrahydrodipicolinate synthase